ncbi:MAG: CHAT domain-containing protein, partial [Caldilineaceae bacterium]|nr:CHAT domain-containing protein [Caldilineaceae bacterium]
TQSPAGEATAHCRLDPADGELGDALAAVAARKVDADFLTQVGTFLFEELFCGEIGQIYRTSLGMVRSQGHRLRVRLRIEPPELASLPWELLHDAQEEQSFAISPEVALVRYVPMRLPVRPSAVTLPLRLLVVLASPIDQPGLDVTTERRHIEEALQERVAKGEVQVTFLEAATVANLQQALRTVQPHIFHFVGHGIFDGERAQLVLTDEEDRSVLIDERIFRELFAGSSETRVAVLNACQTGRTSTVEPLVGLAPRLLQRQLSAVVAMQYAITDQAGLIFAREFYRSLAVGLPVDAAVDEARRGIWLELGAEQPDWAAPALFMRAADGYLFTVKESDSTPSITPPPAPTPPPEVAHFVGRIQELAEFSVRLRTHGLAVITGMAGIGKSSVAAMLAKQMGETAPIFWHTFHTVEDIETVIWKLAAFLAWHQRTDLWNLLQTAKQSGGHPPPPSILLDYLFELLHGTGFVLCLDDFQKVEQAPLTKRFLTLLQQAVSANDLKVILISRHTVDLPNGNGSPPLRGLNQADAHRLIETHGLTIDETIFRQLYSATEGNAELLTLAIAVLTEKQNAEQTIQELVASDNIERFLLMEIDSHLNNDEKAVMSGVAALLGYPGTRTAIEEVLDGSNVARTVAYLCNRNLLFARMGVREREYGEHAIVQSFYYGLLSRRERTAMHLRAATYYESEDVDDLRAALHYFHGRKFDRAATLATRDPAGQISQGRSQALLALLEQLPLHELPEEMQAQLLSVRGDLHYFLFALDDANSCYEAALAKSTGASSAAEAEVARKMAEVLARRGDYQHALTYAEKADRLYQTAKPTVEGALLLAITHGSILMNLGHYHQAKAMAEAQVAQCDVRTSPRLVAELQDLLGK